MISPDSSRATKTEPPSTCLCVNAGSSSLKLTLYPIQPGESLRAIARCQADEIGHPESHLVNNGGSPVSQPLENHRAALRALWPALSPHRITIVGHRLVHGGNRTLPVQLNAPVLDELQALVPLAPLHLPPALELVEAIAEQQTDITQIGCFDTAFHATLPEIARRLPLPEAYDRRGLRHYGFHGLSCEYIVTHLQERGLNTGRWLIAHLGNGSSITAIHNGRSMDTSMGFTPAGGLMMGTRVGDLDPGIPVYLLRHDQHDANSLDHLFNQESGLLGVSSTSSDMAILLNQPHNPKADLAVRMYADRARKSIGALATVLGGIDRLIFTGGIGEHAAPVRRMICQELEFMGIRLNQAANEANAPVISSAGTAVTVEIIPTDEDAMIARHVFKFMEDRT